MTPPLLFKTVKQRLSDLNNGITFAPGQTYYGLKYKMWFICHCGEKYYTQVNSVLKKDSTSCGCSRRGQNNKLYKGCHLLSGETWCFIKQNAKQRNIEFDITIEYAWELFEYQQRKCALSNIIITLSPTGIDRVKKQTASLDRIDSSTGYIEGNVQWVHKHINRIKGVLTEDELFKWVVLMYDHNNLGA